ncbi:MAG: hypothetical protein IJS32_05795 [Kiritimatiellae bacterium]|nr:hypothetical protein [Kiritimatiellia bacterium]
MTTTIRSSNIVNPARPQAARNGRFCQTLANLPRFCRTLAKSKTGAAGRFANVWQIPCVFAEHWQKSCRARRMDLPMFGKIKRFLPNIGKIKFFT